MVNTTKILLLPIGRGNHPEQEYSGNNAFGILGISPEATMQRIKRAYLILASKWHPDKNHSPEAMEQFIRINKAFEFIMKGGDIAKYLALCDITQLKQKFAEALMNIKRTGILTGIDLETPRSSQDRANMSDEEWKKQQRLLNGLLFQCPDCKWKEGCDIATGFSRVEDVYERMVKKSMEQLF